MASGGSTLGGGLMPLALATALALLWIAIAAAISIVAARRLRLADQILGAARANASMIELTPARPLVVRPNDRIEADAQLVRALGLAAEPHALAQLAGNGCGLEADDLAQL